MSASPFLRKANDEASGDFELPPSGLHPARVVGLVDLGTHKNEYKGEVKADKRLIYLAWELVLTKANTGKPFVVGEGYTDSLGKSSNGQSSNYRKLLEEWRGTPFQQNEEFDPYVLLGRDCVVNLSLGLTSKGKKFSQVNSVSPPMQGQNIPDASVAPFFWHFSMWGDPAVDPPIPEWMPRYLGDLVLDVIHESREWAVLKQQQPVIPAANMPPNGNGHSTVQSRHEAPAEVAQQMAAQNTPPYKQPAF